MEKRSTREKFNAWKREIYSHRKLIALSFLLLIIAIVLEYVSGSYVLRVGIAESPDIILDHIKAIDLSWVFVYGYTIIVGLIFLYPLFFNVKKFHNATSQFSLVVIIRSFFISMTHLKTPETAIPVEFPGFLGKLAFENDLFFSGHVAVPFVGYLIFKDSKIRYFFLASSIIMGITALLMHRHYTIDVLAAFFIAYGSYKIGRWMFNLEED